MLYSYILCCKDDVTSLTLKSTLDDGVITSNTVGFACDWVVELGDIDRIGVRISYVIIADSPIILRWFIRRYLQTLNDIQMGYFICV